LRKLAKSILRLTYASGEVATEPGAAIVRPCKKRRF
jgi:hypothetical protein